MPVTFCCRICNHRLSVNRQSAGGFTRCPACEAQLAVPTLQGAMTAAVTAPPLDVSPSRGTFDSPGDAELGSLHRDPCAETVLLPSPASETETSGKYVGSGSRSSVRSHSIDLYRRIKNQQARKNRLKRRRLIKIMGLVSGIAAIVALCLVALG